MPGRARLVGLDAGPALGPKLADELHDVLEAAAAPGPSVKAEVAVSRAGRDHVDAVMVAL